MSFSDRLQCVPAVEQRRCEHCKHLYRKHFGSFDAAIFTEVATYYGQESVIMLLSPQDHNCQSNNCYLDISEWVIYVYCLLYPWAQLGIVANWKN